MAKSRVDEPKVSRPSSAPAGDSRSKKPAYEPPRLLKFEKLEKLIVSGE